METAAPDSPFCSAVPAQLRAWDNTALMLFKECPRKFYYSIVLGWRPKHSAAPLDFGGFLHAGLEEYDRQRFAKKGHREAIAAAVRYLMIATVRREPAAYYNINTPDGPKQVLLATPDGPETLLTPWVGDDKRTRYTLIRTLVWYTEQFVAAQDPCQTLELANGKPAIELSFRFELPLYSPDGEPYLYTGNIDKIGELGGQLYIQERKHTVMTLSGDYFKKYAPDGQTAGYQVAAEVLLNRPVAGLIIDAAQIGVGFSRFHRHIETKARPILDEWLQNTLVWIRLAEHYATLSIGISDPTHLWPMNETSCHKFRGCQFRGICSKLPSMRDTFLRSEFYQNRWNPMQIRGEDL